MAAIPRIKAALAARPLPTVPCHNDLLAENYLDDGDRLWIVDYEYSGNNDPTFELGNTAQELGFDAARQEELCAAYFGPERFSRDGPALMARMRLQMVMSDVGWTLWGAGSSAVSRTTTVRRSISRRRRGCCRNRPGEAFCSAAATARRRRMPRASTRGSAATTASCSGSRSGPVGTSCGSATRGRSFDSTRDRSN
jgi:hypothetical protein